MYQTLLMPLYYINSTYSEFKQKYVVMRTVLLDKKDVQNMSPVVYPVLDTILYCFLC